MKTSEGEGGHYRSNSRDVERSKTATPRGQCARRADQPVGSDNFSRLMRCLIGLRIYPACWELAGIGRDRAYSVTNYKVGARIQSGVSEYEQNRITYNCKFAQLNYVISCFLRCNFSFFYNASTSWSDSQ